MSFKFQAFSDLNFRNFFGVALLILGLLSSFFGSLPVVLASEGTSADRVIEGIVESRMKLPCQNTVRSGECDFVKVILIDGREVNIQLSNDFTANIVTNRDWKARDRVVVVETKKQDGTSDFYIRDPERQPQLWFLLTIVVGLALIVAGFRGIMALVALGLSTAVIFLIFIPQVINGGTLWQWGFLATVIILCINQLIGHGFSKISLVGLLSGFLTLCAAWIIGGLSMNLFRLSGGGGDDIIFIKNYAESIGKGPVDFRGLFLVGVMIGTVGAIDDVVSAQVSTVTELFGSNRNLKFNELYRKAMKVGREHIVSMINTLFLAYAGASLPILMIFSTNLGESVMQLIGREDFTEEIIRSATGSIALLLVVPLSTLLATLFYKRPLWLGNYIKHRVLPLFKK
jgi:uncharacterized membrane protein